MQLKANPSLKTNENHQIYVENNPVAEPGPGQALVHVHACGICGSDVHFWKRGNIGELTVQGPCVLGHEAAGQVIALGAGVTSLSIGDRVAVEPQQPCGECFLCTQGDYNLCEAVEFSSVYPYDGFMQRYKVHPARYLHRIPDNMSYEQGALVEPLSVAYHGLERSTITLGRAVFVAGAGPIGLCALALAHASGATPLVITDLSATRLEFAKKLIPSVRTHQIDPKLPVQTTALAVRALFGPTEWHQPHCVLECTGIESSIATAAYVARRSGTVTVLGVGGGNLNNFPFMRLSLAEIDVRFINRYHDSWPACIGLIANGVVNIDALITHRFPIEQAKEAIECSADMSNGNIKVMVVDE